MKKKFLVKLFLLAMIMLLVTTGASAQVTIGSGRLPSQFSLLDLDATKQQKGLHNARLSTALRDALVSPASEQKDKDLAKGLLLYNTGTGCLEFWNGTRWISLCTSKIPDPCAGLSEADFIFCDDSNPTVDDLNARVVAAGGEGEIQWYDSATDGNLLSGNTPLENGTNYWADNCAGSNYRVPVMVTFVFCGELPPENTNARLTTFINVMYDFQRQTLEAYHTNTGIVISNYQWLVSTDNVNFTVLSGNSSTFEILPFFINNYVTDEKSKELYFRCILTTSTGNILSTVTFRMLFIRTNTSGFGTDENNVHYLTLNRASHRGTGPNTIKVALLNLGAQENDGVVLGDFYQWGRVADGHQRTVWSKDPSSRINRITPMNGNGTTSRVIAHSTSQTYDGNGQITNASSYGSFIRRGTTGDWGNGSSGRGNLWGNGVNSRSGSPVNLSDWAVRAQANNPCPTGWRIPSRFDLGDMHEADGNIDNGSQTNSEDSGTNDNTWAWRGMQANTNAFGAIIITNDHTGESLFLPAAGFRQPDDGALTTIAGNLGVYWTSTMSNSGMSAWSLRFFGNSLSVGSGTGAVFDNLNGFNVRCVKE